MPEAQNAKSSRLMLFPDAVPHQPAIDDWFAAKPALLGDIARHWFGVLRQCGPDVQELLHDHHPTACVGTAAFAEVNVFTAHVNVGFFLGALLPDPQGLLQGTGKFMRHVKLRPGEPVDAAALLQLIQSAYNDMKIRAAGEI
ncbi:DUF1801 domain-containing protein [Rheinheimera texasensis]|jgi:hypothetical protein|uniref:DUF1801 domain-containing protein n=1 Tax=Rheinheimera texasensis TaxID=306205 RepID=UPI0006904B7D|nr:DUF1801 domain-containing protein [Rheinheimera texasensis]